MVRCERFDDATGVVGEHFSHGIFGNVEGEDFHDGDVRVGVGGTAAEEDAVGVFHDCPFHLLAVADETRVQITVVVRIEQVDGLAHQIAIERKAAEMREDDGKRTVEKGPCGTFGGESVARVDEDGKVYGFELIEDGVIRQPVAGRVEFEPMKSVVVGVLLDIPGRGVPVLPACTEIPEACCGTLLGVARTVDSGEREERTVNASPGHGVVRSEITLPRRAGTGEDDGVHDARLMEFALQFVGRDGAAPSRNRLLDGQSGVNVHHSKPMLQFQHLKILGRLSTLYLSVVCVTLSLPSN